MIENRAMLYQFVDLTLGVPPLQEERDSVTETSWDVGGEDRTMLICFGNSSVFLLQQIRVGMVNLPGMMTNH